MNAIVSLCHFCELHGPSVIFCTQTFRDLLGFNIIADIETSELENLRSIQDEEKAKDETANMWKYGKIHIDFETQAQNETPTCVACRSFLHTKPGYISNDEPARVSYISSQYPLQPELYILVRQACIRSLSCEVCPGKEGPIYFGDEARGHVLSYTFFLRDVQARGFKRWYSIMVVMKDKMLLLNSWPFIVKHLKKIISNLQDNASKIYETEESKVSHRALRSAAVMMDNFRKQRVAGQPRSLSEMVGEEGVWQHLHSSFTWLLKASGLKLQERLVEGPPVSTFVENCSVDCEGLNIQQSYNILGSTIFHQLVHHLLIGRQVILRGGSEVIVSALIKSLQPLLPKHCYRAVHYSPHYVDSASCNILGLHSLVSIPQTVMSLGNICVIDLVPKGEIIEGSSKSILKSFSSVYDTDTMGHEAHKVEQMNVPNIEETIKNYTVRLTQEGPLPAKPPQILNRIESAVSNPALTYTTLCICLSTIIYEWINKVKVWIHVKNEKKILHVYPEGSPFPNTSQANHGSLSFPILYSPPHSLASSPVISTLRSMSPGGLGERQQEVTHQDERSQLLAAIGSTEWDIPLLEFWAKNFEMNNF